MSLHRLRNVDFSDRELLHVLDQVGDRRGARAEAVANALGIVSDGRRTPAGTVSVRLSWMCRYGFLRRVEALEVGGKRSDSPYFLITTAGRHLMNGTLNNSVIRAIKQSPGNQLLIMRHLMAQGFVNADAPYATALRREYLNQVAKRRR